MTDPQTFRSRSVALHSPDKFFINGDWVSPRGDLPQFEIVDSATEDVFYSVAQAGPDDMDAAIAAARHAFDHTDWSFLDPSVRAEYLRKLAAGLRARSEEMATYWTRQTGPTFAMAQMSMQRVPTAYDFYADLAETYPWVRPAESPMANWSAVVQEPIGVVAAIVPWNTPLSLATWKIAPALLTGCTVVLKLPPEAPGELLVLAEIAQEIGLPPGVLNVVTGRRGVTEQLVRDPRVNKIGFTGSSEVGKKIAVAASEHLGRFTLELGGKSAAVVLDDYDLERVAAVITGQEVSLSGQNCSSLTRVVVPKKKHAEFADLLGAKFAEVRVGDPFASETQMGPVALQRQQESILGYIRKGSEEGATLVTGGKKPEHMDRGWYVEPTVFANVDRNATIAQEEIFGPVVSIIAADDEDDAIEIANGTPFGLNSAVFSDDPDRAWNVARRLRAGTVGHNGFKVESLLIGFGGVKESGYGREGGEMGVSAYLEPKTVLMDAPPAQFA
ncbi:aldehyde dehydrogenase [Microbacterium sp. Leaf159]|uniref:aldehyde dehydrogenase n=1 Tax=Microbacterium sp. Leaf159 TaxID=1736279 RepID=UPI0006F3BF7F|nr:aldehyde dehydrogenase [Microbacterium sp. Leaf159]KQR37458.1 aldehyde dehydrogenase [Microbacterium sp. Leaf159]